MAERVPLPELYRGTRERLTALVTAHPQADELPVPATPGWTVHDVVAHVTGVAEDLSEGRPLSGGPTPEWTAGHVARGAGIPTADLLERWTQVSTAVEQLLETTTVWPIVLDAGSHEYDVRAALGDRGERDSAVVTVGSHVLLRGLQVPGPLVVRTEHGTVRVGPDAPDAQTVTLVTSAYETFRWRMGRRSRQQLAAMDWSGDPAPYLDHLCVFGPATHDVLE